ncbi:phosphodiester glycosidase family protein [Streptomyces cocklensis]|uniref:Sporulation related protein n=1 Tax=Actinacidiphila cocklensis TaxID=887465 RepID=A0A9W4DNF6_9ACTN|nr:phosphodiester glycosidase family protein [Actinacidiphila cocklensis]MDD1063662.1 phosphodiester glycosidase family protein [Actinacidiphila cocklensis]CAG6391133.1 Sporulation related protein [Actinacidiphila cocklensis]
MRRFERPSRSMAARAAGAAPLGAAAPQGRRRLLVATALSVSVAVTGLTAVSATATTPAGAGRWQWTTQDVAPGVQVRTGTLTRADSAPVWTITVQSPGTSRLTGAASWSDVAPADWATATAGTLTAAGLDARVEDVAWPAYTGLPHGTMGQRVRVGSYTTQAAATAAARSVTAAHFHAAVQWTGYDAQTPADRENVHVAVIDPHRFTGTVEGTHDGSVTQRETTSSVAAGLGSLVGVNAGFFVTADADGVQGTQSGIGAYDGQLQSMASGTRAALVIQNGGHRFRVANLATEVTARVGGASLAVQGINRVPGTVRDCGRPGARPSDLPWQDVTCTLADDAVLFTDRFSAALPTGAGTQAVLDAAGRVVSVGARGGAVPAGDRVLQGIGSAGDWLSAHAVVGRTVQVDEEIRDEHGGRVHLGPRDSIVSAAPVLVRNGRVGIDAVREGTMDPKDLSYGYAWSEIRQPRTLAGVDARGRLILATVDGRLAGGSEGFTLNEAASFIRSLGAVQALNLDGGGSTAMAVNGTLVNSTSDATGERAVGDTVQVLPQR